jgi:hypothetical protein
MMQYIKVKWIHDFTHEPVVLYSELDDDRWEVRKVEAFRDGRMCRAGAGEATAETMPSETPIPTLDEIAVDPQFEPQEIETVEFEAAWVAAGNVGI